MKFISFTFCAIILLIVSCRTNLLLLSDAKHVSDKTEIFVKSIIYCHDEIS